MNQIQQTINQSNRTQYDAAAPTTINDREGAPVTGKLKKVRIIYRIGIILLSLIFFTSGFFEITGNPIVWQQTINLGYPPYFIVLLGIAKISGVIVLLIPGKLNWLKEWVFVGLFYDVIFAFASNYATAHFSDAVPAVIAFILILATYTAFRKINPILKISF